MSNSISFVPGSQLRSVNFNDFICYSIQPLIQKILDQFLSTKNLDTAISNAVNAYPKIANNFFELDQNNISDSFSLKKEFLFPAKNPLLKIIYSNGKYLNFLGKRGVKVFEDQSSFAELHHLLHLCGQSCLTYEQICQQVSDSNVELLDEFIRCSIVAEQPQQASTIPAKTPGIFRLQHASLLYRTETTGVLVDPHLHSNYGLPKIKNDITRAQLEGNVDAVIISHSHYDHWHYPTLMMLLTPFRLSSSYHPDNQTL